MKFIYLFAFLFLLFIPHSSSLSLPLEDGVGYPAPGRELETRATLFRITKNENRNYVVYDLLFDRRCHPLENPLDVYWMMGERRGEREELNRMEERLYGATLEQIDEESGLLRFFVNGVEQKEMEAEITEEQGTLFTRCHVAVYTQITKQRAKVKNIHLLIEKSWNPFRPRIKIVLKGLASVLDSNGIPRWIEVEETIDNTQVRTESMPSSTSLSTR
ncbi:MAG: DUF4833 domain-containing protein [Deltaproteobacteria bacterium]|nr:DUF4833 domain-containing protein [Deltaproteobacteria bacterium]